MLSSIFLLTLVSLYPMAREQVRRKIDLFFEQKNFDKEDLRKIKRTAMHNKMRLGKHRARFCKKCSSSLVDGKIKVNKTHKMTKCKICGYLNKIRIS